MNKNIWVVIGLGASLAMTSACSSSTASDNNTSSTVRQLFTPEPTPDRSILRKTASGNLVTLLADPANQEITLVDVDPTVVSNNTKSLMVTLPDGKAAQFNLHDYKTITPGIDGWVGYKSSEWKKQHSSGPTEIDIDPLYYLSLVREGNTVVGSVIIDGQRYRLETLAPGKYAFIKVDESKLPPEAEPLVGVSENNKMARTVTPASEHSIIRVLMVSTNEARAANSSYRAAMAGALQDANAYMANSRVNITYELAGYFDADYEETGKSSQLGDLKATSRPLGASVAPVRDALRADLVTMYSTTRAYCGMGYLTSGRTTGFSVVACLSSMGHELGHNLGATHNWEPGDNERNPPYMFGYPYTGTPRFRTQMSYDCSGGTCPKVPYHSNPRITYQGVALGTVEHHDAARRFNERRETVENFYPHVVTYTLYEHENYQGQSCTIMHGDMETSYLTSRCGSGWDRKVSSLRIGGVVPGLTIELWPDGVSQTRIYSRTFTGELDVPTMNKAPNFPAGVERVWGGRADDLLQRLSNSR
ncbi:M12 family metallo-peptidase [Pseudomonas sp. SAS7]|uniref:M12 family metallo-peptidase n=1 Tax=Pseudomonas sp. SAS7 TaxID=3156487 RepID=UPI003F99ABBF